MKGLSATAIILAIVVGSVSFIAGTKYEESKTPQLGGTFQGGARGMRMMGPGGPGGLRGGQRFRPVMGEIISRDSDSITVKLPDGSSKIVLTTKDTSVNKVAQVSDKELKAGQKVGIFGTENSDGSVSAQNIQLDPNFGAFPGGGNNAR